MSTNTEIYNLFVQNPSIENIYVQTQPVMTYASSYTFVPMQAKTVQALTPGEISIPVPVSQTSVQTARVSCKQLDVYNLCKQKLYSQYHLDRFQYLCLLPRQVYRLHVSHASSWTFKTYASINCTVSTTLTDFNTCAC